MVWYPRKSVLLYLDEIAKIVALIRQTGIEITADTADFSGSLATADDLTILPNKSLTDCTITGRLQERSIVVSLSHPTSVTISPSDDLALVGASNQVQEIIRKSARTFGGPTYWNRNTTSPGLGIALLLLMAGFILFAISFSTNVTTHTSKSGIKTHETSEPNSHLRPYAAIPIGVGILLSLGEATLMKNPRPKGTVVLAYRIEAPTWWDRNRTALGISLATNVAVAILFFLIGRALGP
jgi:hypothetical protein